MTLKAKLQTLLLYFIPLVLLSLNSPVLASTPITCGTVATSTISTSGEQDDYTFTVPAGQTYAVTIRLTRTSGTMDPYLQLYNPGGERIAYNYSETSNYAQIDHTNLTEGEYTIKVSDHGSDGETGDYSLIWQRTDSPCGATPITCGTVSTGTLGAIGEQNFYTFSASANDKVTIRLISTSNLDPYLELYHPNGTKITQYAICPPTTGNYAKIDTTLPVTGTYTLIVSDCGQDESGGYRLYWQKLNNPCNTTSISCGLAATSSLSVPGEQDFFTLNVNANDAVTIRLITTAGGMNPYLELFKPDGTPVMDPQGNCTGNYCPVNTVLNTAGTYMAIVSDCGNDASGNYNLSWNGMCQ